MKLPAREVLKPGNTVRTTEPTEALESAESDADLGATKVPDVDAGSRAAAGGLGAPAEIDAGLGIAGWEAMVGAISVLARTTAASSRTQPRREEKAAARTRPPPMAVRIR